MGNLERIKTKPTLLGAGVEFVAQTLADYEGLLRAHNPNLYRPKCTQLLNQFKSNELKLEEFMSTVTERIQALEMVEQSLALSLPDQLDMESLNATLLRTRLQDILN